MVYNNTSSLTTYGIDIIKHGQYQHPFLKHIHIHEFFMTFENVYKQLHISVEDMQPVFYGNSQVKYPSLKSGISASQHELFRHSSDTGEWCDLDLGHLGVYMSVSSMIQDLTVPVKQNEELNCPEQRWLLDVDSEKKQGVINGNTSLQNLAKHINNYCIPKKKPLPKGLFRFKIYVGVQEKELLMLAERLNSTADIAGYTLDNLADKLDPLKASLDGRLDRITGKPLPKTPAILQASSVGKFEVSPTVKYPENAVVFIQNDPEKQASALDPMKVMQVAHSWNIEKFSEDEHPFSVVNSKKSAYDYYSPNLPEAIRIIAPIAGDANFIKQWIMSRAHFWAACLDEKKTIPHLIETKHRIGGDNNGRGTPISDATRINTNRLFDLNPKNGFSFEGKKKYYGFIDEKDPIVQHYNVFRIKQMKHFRQIVESIAIVMAGSLRMFLKLNEHGVVSYAEGYSRNKIIDILESGLGHEMLCILLQETDMSVESVEFADSQGSITGKSISTVTKNPLPWAKVYGVAEKWLAESDERSKYWSSLINSKSTSSTSKEPKQAVKVPKTFTANS